MDEETLQMIFVFFMFFHLFQFHQNDVCVVYRDNLGNSHEYKLIS